MEALSKAVRKETGSNVFRCYQCIKCTSGCPLADQFDLTPNQVMRSLQLGDDKVLESRAIWLCASCQTCATRCPQEIDVTGVMDALRIEAKKRGVKPAIPEIDSFNSVFLKGIKMLGRNYELGFMGAYNMARGRPFQDMGMGLEMLKKGKLKILPHISRPPKKVSKAEYSSNAVGYYPGCSLESAAVEYDRSVRAVSEALGIELVEPPGWVCCGSSPAHAVDPTLAKVLPMHTVGTVERMGLDTVTSPCSACFARLKAAEQAVAGDGETAREVETHTGHAYQGTVEVAHLLDVFVDRAGLEKVESAVRTFLVGMKVACYYGCLITRPNRVTGAEHPEYPMKMDYLARALGAESVDWSYKTECCGNSLSVTRTPVALGLTRKILENARACGADAVVTMCPMCQINLDARQPEMGLDAPIPVFYMTQLMALAFGLGGKAASFDKNMVDPRPLLAEKSLST